MKKSFIILSCLVFTSVLSAQELSGWWTGGNFGVNGYYSDDCSTGLMVDVDILDFAIRHNETGLQLNFTPVHFDSFAEEDDDIQQKNNLDTFLNAKFGIDLLKNNVELDLMPYVSLNWAPLKSLSSYRVEAGLEFDWFTDIILGINYPLRVKVASFKTAYGFRRNEPYFTVGASIDFGAFVYAALWSWIDDETDD